MITIKKTVVILFFPLVVLVLFSSLSSALSQISIFPIEKFLSRTAIEEKISEKLFLKFIAAVNYSSKLEPTNSDYNVINGKLLLSRYEGKNINEKKEREKSLDYFRRAVSLRPAWPYGWANLAFAKASLGEFDEEFYRSYNKAAQYGQWEFPINQSLSVIGLYYWNAINSTGHLELKKILTRMYVIKSGQTIQLASKYGQLRMACLWMLEQAKSTRLCERNLSY